jgi:hypothetical protein
MCATQIARLATERLNAARLGHDRGLSRFVTFLHTEGCGFGGDAMYRLLERTYLGYLTHPNVACALLLEHGCEKIPNDVMRRQLESAGLPLDRYGWSSVQLDGGIERALANIEAWFAGRLDRETLPSLAAVPAAIVPAFFDPAAADPAATVAADTSTPLPPLTVGLVAATAPSAAVAAAFAATATAVLAAGGSVLLAESDPLLAAPAFRTALLGDVVPHATLAYGQPVRRPGLHVVASETDLWEENVTGFGGNGAHLVLGLVDTHARHGHPLVPVVQFAEPVRQGRLPADDIDGFFSGNSAADADVLREWIIDLAGRRRLPVSAARGFVDFQLTRGELGLTT